MVKLCIAMSNVIHRHARATVDRYRNNKCKRQAGSALTFSFVLVPHLSIRTQIFCLFLSIWKRFRKVLSVYFDCLRLQYCNGHLHLQKLSSLGLYIIISLVWPLEQEILFGYNRYIKTFYCLLIQSFLVAGLIAQFRSGSK